MRLLVLSALLPLAGCVAGEPTPPPGEHITPPVENICGAAGLQGLIGQSAAVLATLRFTGPVRVIKPGMAVTMDHSAARLNITLDGQDIISGVYCG